MKYKTFLEVLFFIALLSTVIIMTVNNVEAIPNYYRVEIDMMGHMHHQTTANLEPIQTHIYVNGIRVYEGINNLLNWPFPVIPIFDINFNVNHAINTLYVKEITGVAAVDNNPHYTHISNVAFRIYRNNTLITSGGSSLLPACTGIEFYNLDLPCPSFPCPCFPFPLPPPIFELPPSPVLTPPVTRPEFFNFTSLIPFFTFVDGLFLPIAQIIINIIWIPLGILDFINRTLINFWSFFDTHVLYSGFLDVLGFLRMFFEIPEVMLLMVFGLSLVVIKIYLKR